MPRSSPLSIVRRLIGFAVVAGFATLTSGCIGVYSNKKMFDLPPAVGMDEVNLITTYGAPDYAGFAETRKIYAYRVRDNKYILMVGIYEGYDLIVTCENGVVWDVSRVDRPKAFSLLQPVPWAETN